jgi:DNA-directed RNA polymerase specialized sigma subunit
MDLVQISCEGLMSAVDKFVLPYSKVFRSVAIGRIVGNFIENYSETLIHFYPQDKRKIYRANKTISRQPVRGLDMIDFDHLVDEVNKEVEKSQMTNTSEISNLLAAASHVSADATPPETENESRPSSAVGRYADDVSCQPDYQVENAQLKHVFHQASQWLTWIERKLLRMKGIELPIPTDGSAIPSEENNNV